MNWARRFLHTIFITLFIFSGLGSFPLGASTLVLPAPGTMVGLSPRFHPPVLRGVSVDPAHPLRLMFILDGADDAGALDQSSSARTESLKLIKYFLTSLAVPEQNMWVNLSPYEKDRIAPSVFGRTEMGRDLLAQDYLLKQITASLIYPQHEFGRKFWKRVYGEASRRYGTNFVQVNTFNKVWIVPEKAVIYENPQSSAAFVVESRLKVLLEEDYLSLSKHAAVRGPAPAHDPRGSARLGTQIIKEIVLPELAKEINEGKNFAPLRQIYNSLILAAWYKRKINASLLSRGYADQSRVGGMQTPDPNAKQKIYAQYLQAFKQGAYNIIQEEADPITNRSVPRKYFSGGVVFEGIDKAMTGSPQVPASSPSYRVVVTDLAMMGPNALPGEVEASMDKAMLERSVEARLKLAKPGQLVLMHYRNRGQRRDIEAHLRHLGLQQQRVVAWGALRFAVSAVRDWLPAGGWYGDNTLGVAVADTPRRFVVVNRYNWPIVSSQEWMDANPQVQVLIVPAGLTISRDPQVQKMALNDLARMIGAPTGDFTSVLELSRTYEDTLRLYGDGMDGLTGLLKREAGGKVFGMKVAEINRGEGHYRGRVMLLDVDAFKAVNDIFGHVVGDAVLRAVGRIIRKVARGMDLVVREGGEEIMIVDLQMADAKAGHANHENKLFERVLEAILEEAKPNKDDPQDAAWAILSDPQAIVAKIEERLNEGADKETFIKGLRHQLSVQNNMTPDEVDAQLASANPSVTSNGKPPIEDYLNAIKGTKHRHQNGQEVPFVFNWWVITVSAGVATFDFQQKKVPTGWAHKFWVALKKAADGGLYHAKATRNKIVEVAVDPRSLGIELPGATVHHAAALPMPEAVKGPDTAMAAQANTTADYGGIDLDTTGMEMKVRPGRGGVAWKIDPGQLQSLRKASGLVPFVVDVHPLWDLPGFLGINEVSRKSNVARANTPPRAAAAG